MNDLAPSNGKRMTVREIAEALGYDPRTIQLKVKELFPDIVSERQTTYLNEVQVTAIKIACEKNFAVTTDLEMMLLDRRVSEWKTQKIEELQQKLQVKESELAIAAPKAEFYDAVADSKDAIHLGDVAKVLAIGLGRNKLFELLRRKKILMSDNVPYQEYIDRGYFRIIENPWSDSRGQTHVSVTTLVYQRGVDFIRKIAREAA